VLSIPPSGSWTASHRVAALRARPALAARARGARRPGRRLGPGGRRLLGLLEAEAQAVPLGVERDDLELERLALVDDVTRMGDALVGQLADVDQALEAVADADERAEVDELGDRAVDDVADLEVRDRGVPRVGLQAADRQADPATLVVDVDDLGLDLVADLVAGLGVVDLVPRELALVDEAVDAAEVDEHAERARSSGRAGDLLADLQAAEQLVALLAALLVQGDLLRQDQAVRLAVDLEDLEPELAADERLSFSAISWAASRGWSFCGRRGKSTIWLIGTKPRMPQSTMRPPLLWSMTGASMMTPASNCSCIAAPLALEAGAAERQDAWPSGDSGWRT
jgi:hypothetical protein